MNKPLVSICIPVYNGGKYLEDSLNSCINQSYINYEILICDDGSTDGSIALIERYLKANAKISFFKNEHNLGLVANWNKCLELAKGEWIKFVFQDDYISNNCLQDFVNEIDEASVLMLSERNFILPENPSEDYVNYYTREVRTLKNTTDHKGPVFSAELISRTAVQNMCMNFIGEPSLSFFKKEVTQELGFFNPALKQICDLEFVLRIAGKYGLKYLPKKLCTFRIHGASTTSTNVQNKFFELKYIEPLLFSYFLLFDKRFEAFRRNLNFGALLKLKLYFKVKTYQANVVNLKEDHKHYLFESSNVNFREVYENRKGNFLIQAISALFVS